MHQLIENLCPSHKSCRPDIGYLHEAMEKVKDAIQDNLKGKVLYMPVLKEASKPI